MRLGYPSNHIGYCLGASAERPADLVRGIEVFGARPGNRTNLALVRRSLRFLVGRWFWFIRYGASLSGSNPETVEETHLLNTKTDPCPRD